MSRKLAILILTLITLTIQAQTCPDEHHPHAIDLGLPSGTLWACCNIGAASPEEYGGYFAWGETEEKEEYTYENYIHSDGTWDTCHNLGDSINGTNYDVARVKWGEEWKMPSLEQVKELIYCTAYLWTTVGQTKGATFSANGKSIFLPASGRLGSTSTYLNQEGQYWTAMPSTYGTFYAYHLGFGDSWVDWMRDGGRKNGLSVRAVSIFPSGIREVTETRRQSSQSIYSISGVKVADHAADLQHLKPGLYIVNGKVVNHPTP